MNDLEISKRLALAIGHPEKGMYVSEYARLLVAVKYPLGGGSFLPAHRAFDYRDWAVIGPIAERYDCFPAIEPHSGEWFSFIGSSPLEFADTPQKAIALAVIEGAGK